jgi:UDP-GlcNAc:undecaprenyl-phosphate GlcNAc-1-phosphate transferase
VHNVQLFGRDFELGLLAWPFTLFWLLGAINSVNLIDGADGLAATVGVILNATIAGMAILTGHELEAIVALALTGALLGFLIFNFPPATIFLGDAGSMVIGLLAGALAMRCALKGPASYAMIAPLAIWAVPAFDCSVAILRRKLTGRSIAATDRGHLHHCLLRRGFDNRQMLCWVAVLCLITATGAIVSLRLQNEFYALAAVAVMMAVMMLTRIFGHAEFLLVASSVRKLGASFVVPTRHNGNAVHHTTHHLQGSRDWDSLWRLLTETADGPPLQSIKLNLNVPWLHESYHASWEREPRLSSGEGWKLEMPLTAQGRTFGTLTVRGRAPAGQMAACMAKWSEQIELIEEHLATLVAPTASPVLAHEQAEASEEQSLPVAAVSIAEGEGPQRSFASK